MYSLKIHLRTSFIVKVLIFTNANESAPRLWGLCTLLRRRGRRTPGGGPGCPYPPRGSLPAAGLQRPPGQWKPPSLRGGLLARPSPVTSPTAADFISRGGLKPFIYSYGGGLGGGGCGAPGRARSLSPNLRPPRPALVGDLRGGPPGGRSRGGSGAREARPPGSHAVGGRCCSGEGAGGGGDAQGSPKMRRALCPPKSLWKTSVS